MAKVKAQITQILNNIIKDVRSQVAKQRMQLLANEALRLILERTRAGFGVKDSGGRISKLKKLSPKYVAYRKRNRRLLSSTTSPETSNVTFTGQMLESLKVQQAANGRASIRAPGKHKSGPSNEKIVLYLAGQGRVFLNLSKTEVDKLLYFYETRLVKLKR